MMTLRSLIPAALGAVLALFAAAPASAGVATAGAVLLDPFDPVPEIQFHHFGGYGCSYGCGSVCDSGCGARYDGGCYDGCRRHYRRHRDCEDGCRRYVRDDCDHDCRGHDHEGRDGDRDGHDRRDGYDHRDVADEHDGASPPCVSGHCYDAEHWERRWRDGDHVGQQWEDRGTRERSLPQGGHTDGFYGHDYDWRVDDDPPPPPPPAVIDDDHDHHHHH
jgi:hypothetical protein